jgi:hypothetical protein
LIFDLFLSSNNNLQQTDILPGPLTIEGCLPSGN